MKKRIMGTNKLVTPISRTVVSPGDDPKHELVVLEISRLTNSIQIRAVIRLEAHSNKSGEDNENALATCS